MKRFLSFLIALIMIFTLCSCRKKGDLGAQTKIDTSNVVEYKTVSDFDYSKFKKENEAKAITQGFKNTQESKCRDKSEAKALALKEINNDFVYNEIKIAFDRTEGVWRVTFSFTETGSVQHICIGEKGNTILIVKGE